MFVSNVSQIGGTGQVSLENLAKNSQMTEQQKVAEASRQFEAILLRQIISQARKTLVTSEYNKESSTSGIYMDLVNSQMAENISRTGQFGLGKALEKEWSKSLSSQEAGKNAVSPKTL